MIACLRRRLASSVLAIALLAGPAHPAGAHTPLSIHDIQGAAHVSPYAGQTVSDVPGIVTALRSNGFYLQEPQPDDDPATSEGIFVFTRTKPSVAVGDAIRVSGSVTEFRPRDATGAVCEACLTTTEIDSPTIAAVSKGSPLPAPVVIGAGGRQPPTLRIEDDASGDVETSGVFDPQSDGIDFFESLEGMLVQVNEAVVVGPTQVFGSGSSRNSEMRILADNGNSAALRTPRGGVLVQPGQFNPERIMLNDLITDGPNLPAANVGDTLPGAIVGVVDYSFGNYKLQVTAMPPLVPGGLARSVAVDPLPNELSVASFNVENLSPGDPPGKFAGLATLIVDNLRSPDLIAVEEIQDNDGASNDGVVDASNTYRMLTSAIANAGGPRYDVRQIDPVDGQDGGQPGGNIRQGFLFRSDRGLQFIDQPGGTSISSTTVINGKGTVELSASPGRIDPSNSAWTASRKPLVGEFMFNGQLFFVIANHLVAKVSDDPLYGRFQPPREPSRVQRMQQTQVVHDFAQSIVRIDPAARVVVLGDMNDFQFSDPINILTGANVSSPILTDLADTLPENERYSYDFEGNSETLDHILVSRSLLGGATFEPMHVNAEFADQASDHDPMLARLTFGP